MADVFYSRTTSVNQAPGGGTDYPFLSPSDDIVGLFSDLYLSFEDTACRFVYPFRLSYIFGFIGLLVDVLAAESEALILTENGRPLLLSGGPVPDNVPMPLNPREIRIVDALGEIVFDSVDAIDYKESQWGDNLSVIEWITATQVCRVVYRTDSITPTFYIEPADSRLDQRTCNRLPRRVETIRVGSETLLGAVSFSAGYNIKLEAATTERTDGGKRVDAIDLDAVIGAGLGRFPGCEDTTPVLRSINNVKPVKGGNFLVTMDSCGRVQAALTVDTEAPGYVSTEDSVFIATEQDEPLLAYGDLIADATGDGLQISDDCHPCRECSYYVRTYKGLKRIWDRWKTTAQTLEQVRDAYEANRTRWLNEYQCVVGAPVRAVAQSAKGCKVFIGTSFCNPTGCCVGPVVFRVTLFRYKDGAAAAWGDAPAASHATIIGGSGKETSAVPETNGSVLTFTADYAAPNSSVLLRLRVAASCGENEVLLAHVAAYTGEPDDSAASCDLPEGNLPGAIGQKWVDEGADPLPAGLTLRGTAEVSAPFDTTPTF